MSFEIEIGSTRTMAVLSCRGRLVLEQGAPVLREIAGRELSRFQSIGLDLGFVTQLDARGVGVIAELCQTARNAGRVLVLTGVNERVLRIFRLTRLDTLVPRLREQVGGDPSESIHYRRDGALAIMSSAGDNP